MNNKFPIGRTGILDMGTPCIAYEMTYDNSTLDTTRLKDYLNLLKPESERMVPDKRGCEAMFSRTFVRGDMEWDFPLIVRDFLKHEAANLEQYRDLSYGAGKPEYSSLKDCWQHIMVHAMYTGAKKGSEYCIALLKYLFRTYYPKLYRTFKRFRKFSADDVLSLADTENTGHYAPELVSVLLCMAEVFDIRLDRSCDVLFLFEEETNYQASLMYEVDFYEIDEDVFVECRKRVQELFPEEWRALVQKKVNSEKFTRRVLEYCGYPFTFLSFSREEPSDLGMDLTRTLALLKSVYPNKAFSAQEVLQYSNLFDAILALADTTDICYRALIDVLGMGDDACYEEEGSLFEPEKIVVREPAAPKQPIETTNVSDSTKKKDDGEYSQERLLKEIEVLRDRLHYKEEEARHLRERLQAANRQLIEQSVIIREAEQNRQELAALRGHLYHFTEYDEVVEESKRDEIIRNLESKRVTIVGGHTNWVQKIKKLFPDWKYISPNVSVSNISQLVSHAEFVYFFTDTLSHSVYGTFIQMVREKNIPFGYIHGVNIDANIKQMWEEIRDYER